MSRSPHASDRSGRNAYHPTVADRVLRRAMSALGGAPLPLLRAVVGRPRVVDGQTLDPRFQLGIRALGLVANASFEDMPIAEARRTLDREAFTASGARIDLPRVEDRIVPVRDAEIPARLYSPVASHERLPLLVYYHGGGWTLGGLDSHDATCRFLARTGRLAVLSVDYRLAPEHRFPTAVNDAVDAFRWARDRADGLGVDAGRIAVGGDSAGGNLAAVVCQQTRDAGERTPAFQLLFVPAVDMSSRTRSYALFDSGYFLTRANMDFYEHTYLRDDSDRTDPRASPLLAEDLSGLPPAYVAVAGFDPLRDEGEAYARRLADAGVRVALRRHSDLVHPFVNAVGASPAARNALSEAVGALRMGLGY